MINTFLQSQGRYHQYLHFGKGKITIKQPADMLGTTKVISMDLLNTKKEPIITEFKSLTKIKEQAKKNLFLNLN